MFLQKFHWKFGLYRSYVSLILIAIIVIQLVRHFYLLTETVIVHHYLVI